MILTLPDVTPGMSAFLNQQRSSRVTLPVLQVQLMDWYGKKTVDSNQVSVCAVFGSANGSTFVDQFGVPFYSFMNFVKESQNNMDAMEFGLRTDGAPYYMGVDPGGESKSVISVVKPKSKPYEPMSWTDYFVTIPIVPQDEMIFVGPRGQVAKIKGIGRAPKPKLAIEEEKPVVRMIEVYED